MVGTTSCVLPADTYSLRLIDMSNHRHKYYGHTSALLRAANYHLMFSRDMDNGVCLLYFMQKVWCVLCQY